VSRRPLWWRMLRRDFRAGELRVLVLALVIAVTGVSTVGFFSDRVAAALEAESSALLAGDLALLSDHPSSPAFAEEALRRRLEVARTVAFPSMLLHGERTQLAEVKWVAPGYPLRGVMATAPDTTSEATSAAGVPERGELWVEASLLARLGVRPGDRVQLGDGTFRIGKVLKREPDVAFNFFNIAPHAVARIDDLDATGLVQPASRISYRVLFAGRPADVESFRRWAETRVGRGERLEGVRDARPEVRATLDRAGRFLGLAALMSVLLAAVAVSLATRRYIERHYDGCAVMRCLGATQATLLRLYLAQFAVLAIAGGLAGVAVGYLAQAVLGSWLSGLAGVSLPAPGVVAALQGLLAGAILLFGFAAPPLLRLRGVPALRVLRRDLDAPGGGDALAYAVGIGALVALAFWRAGDARLGAYVVASVAVALLVAAGSAAGLLALAARARSRLGGSVRYGLAAMRRRPASSIAQIVALSLGIMALLLLTLVRSDLMTSWRTRLPADAPNRFVINIQPDQVEDFRAFFAQRGWKPPEILPMVRGRLTRIGDHAVSAGDYPDLRLKRLVEREFNLSWAAEPRPDNEIVAGRWWSAGPAREPEFSVEQGIARDFDLHVGDRLTFDVAGTPVSARISNLRKLDWDSFRVNFFVIASPGTLDSLPASFITSFHLAAGGEPEVDALVKRFPNLTVIDAGAIVHQIQEITAQVARAIEFVFLFSLLAGLAVLYAAIAATQDERRHESAVMRTLGARTAQLVRGQLAEFAALGLLAGAVASVAAMAAGYWISVRVLSVPYRLDPWIPLLGMGGGVFGVGLAGYLGTRAVARVAPIAALRRYA
jgi:putative ABC transport system permease protein